MSLLEITVQYEEIVRRLATEERHTTCHGHNASNVGSTRVCLSRGGHGHLRRQITVRNASPGARVRSRAYGPNMHATGVSHGILL